MSRTPILAAILTVYALLALACKGGDDVPDSPTESTPVGDDSPEHSDPLSADDMPANPSPFNLTVSGAWPTTLTFDQPTCSSPVGSSNLRVFWRGSDHVAVLVLDVLGTYTGAGDYNETEHGLRARLQEEAGGSGYYFATEPGDTISATVVYDDDTVAWGEYTVSAMQGDGGTITFSPATIPIWCGEFI